MNFADLWALAKKSAAFILAATLAIGALGFGLSALSTKKYAATSTVLVQLNDPSESLQSATAQNSAIDPSINNAFIQTQLGVITGLHVLEAARAKVPGIDFDHFKKMVTASQVASTSLVQVVAKSADRTQARDVANAVVAAYAQDRKDAAIGGLDSALKQVDDRLTTLRDQLTKLTADAAAPLSAASAAASAQLKAVELQYSELYSRQQELQINLNLKRGGIEIVSEAQLPKNPVEPKPLRNGLIAAFLGLILAAGAVFARDRLDTSVRSAEDLRSLKESSVLASVPEYRGDREARSLVVVDNPFSPFSESVRGLRTSLQFASFPDQLGTLVFTSTVPGEGKTTLAANLASAHAQSGRRVLFVSADLRRPTGDALFGFGEGEEGLSDIALSVHLSIVDKDRGDVLNHDLERVIRPTADERLFVLPAGTIPPNPNELLGSEAIRLILGHVAERFDVVIIDTPPIASVSDALLLASVADGVVLVVGSGMVDQHRVKVSVERIQGAGLRLVGLVVNRIKPSDDEYVGAYGAYSASSSSSGGRFSKRKGASSPAPSRPATERSTADRRAAAPGSSKPARKAEVETAEPAITVVVDSGNSNGSTAKKPSPNGAGNRNGSSGAKRRPDRSPTR